MREICNFELGLWEYGAWKEEHMESIIDVQICRSLIIGFVDEENVQKTNLSEIPYIKICI